ncbi:hypothetical protein [Rhodoferax sp. OV413]|uniref:hypothetical protein n=1 Tax=Rhodoferax sp. OV413 TaxID=1855285 RepID=UPI0025E68041|nr:hypothetical protein [Rhodoferax sp. OV413]
MKNKTLAVWLTLSVGALGLHRLYLGRYDWVAKLSPVPTLLGLVGVMRARTLGIDDPASWLLIPLLGFVLAACALNALVYGLMSAEKWNQQFNPDYPDSAQGATTGLTVCGLVTALGLGTTILIATLAYTIQHVFEFQLH